MCSSPYGVIGFRIYGILLYLVNNLILKNQHRDIMHLNSVKC